jgi:hypothetical protein
VLENKKEVEEEEVDEDDKELERERVAVCSAEIANDSTVVSSSLSLSSSLFP